MGRSESKAVTQQGQQQSAQDQANAQASFGGANKAIGDYKTALTSFMGANPYTAGGEYQTAQEAVGNNVAAGGQNAVTEDINQNATRTGENSANNAATIAESRRSGQRNLANFLSNANVDRIGKNTAYQTTGLDASSKVPGMYSGLYSGSVGAANGALGNAASAAKTPGFWDTMAPAIVGAAGQVAAGYCPCEGSMIRMADGTEKPVEQLKKGDMVFAHGSPNAVLEDVAPSLSAAFAMETASGLKHSGSDTHTVSLAGGGYGFLPELKGQNVATHAGADAVVSVESIGEKTVYPVKLGGSHVYMADNIWIVA